MSLPRERLPGLSVKHSSLNLDTSACGELILWLFAFDKNNESIGLYSVYVERENFQRAFDLLSTFARVKRKHFEKECL